MLTIYIIIYIILLIIFVAKAKKGGNGMSVIGVEAKNKLHMGSEKGLICTNKPLTSTASTEKKQRRRRRKKKKNLENSDILVPDNTSKIVDTSERLNKENKKNKKDDRENDKNRDVCEISSNARLQILPKENCDKKKAVTNCIALDYKMLRQRKREMECRSLGVQAKKKLHIGSEEGVVCTNESLTNTTMAEKKQRRRRKKKTKNLDNSDTLASDSEESVDVNPKLPELCIFGVWDRLNKEKKKTNRNNRENDKNEDAYEMSNNAKLPVLPKENCDKDKTITKCIAIDCEMVGVGDGTESVLARVSIVNVHCCCIYDKYVKPIEPVRDYRTEISGIRPRDLETGEDFSVVQKEVREILKGRILIGHALIHDLRVLHLSHPRRRLRDTSNYTRFKQLSRGATPSLKKLAFELLGRTIQTGEHSSIEDAKAAMQLYLLYRNKWESELHFRR